MEDRPSSARADYESHHITRPEYIAAIVHLYRGELYRANSWRLRLDTTTNWSILTTAGLLSFSFGSKEHSHWVLLLGFLVITLLLAFEARRFRFFDVWRYRVRMIEENFYGPILRRDPVSPDRQWGKRVAHDLLHPQFKITFNAALRARFTRNYWAIYGVLLVAWLLKVIQEPVPARSWAHLRANLETGVLPWYVALCYVGVVIVGMLTLVLFFPRTTTPESAYWSPTNPEDSTQEDVPAWDT
jgi:uncharacterized membrane protein